jgi:hypothetical protein
VRDGEREREREKYQCRGCGGARPEGESAVRNLARETMRATEIKVGVVVCGRRERRWKEGP